ncbi:MAG: M14 family metallopeptidase [Chloroflexi bacterium]|nr:M14 family metallopeptidase [Chloroflexota bacterium]
MGARRPGWRVLRVGVAILLTAGLLAISGVPVILAAPGEPPAPPGLAAAANATPTPSKEPAPEPTAPPTSTDEAHESVGKSLELTRSVEGRAIQVVELGGGPRWVAAIGGIHQGNEANTTDLVELLLDHFRANLDLIPDGVGLALIPDLNPDGAVAGTRENANGVDLNRNWDSNWQPDSYGPSGLVVGGGGARPFSEPETRALARYLVDRPFVAAIFYHSLGALVVAGHGDDGGSAELARVIALAAQYLYLTEWTVYPLSGQATDYLANQGIHAVDVELTNYTDPDFARNLRGLTAALAWARTLDAPPHAERNIPEQISTRCGCKLGVDCPGFAPALCLW